MCPYQWLLYNYIGMGLAPDNKIHFIIRCLVITPYFLDRHFRLIAISYWNLFYNKWNRIFWLFFFVKVNRATNVCLYDKENVYVWERWPFSSLNTRSFAPPITFVSLTLEREIRRVVHVVKLVYQQGFQDNSAHGFFSK